MNILVLFADEVMGENARDVSNTTAGAAWTAIIMGIVNAILLTVQMIWRGREDRKREELKAQIENDRVKVELQRERDKRESDSTLVELRNKTIELENANKRCEAEREKDKAALKEEILIRDKRYDDIIKLILKREEDMEDWRKNQEQKVTKLESASDASKLPTVP